MFVWVEVDLELQEIEAARRVRFAKKMVRRKTAKPRRTSSRCGRMPMFG